jgi:predicted amidohydrolase YtcJ
MLISQAELGDGIVADVRFVDGAIAEIAPILTRRPGEETVAGARGALIVGLHDHHLHLQALAASRSSLNADGLAKDSFVSAVRAEAGKKAGWIRVTGYHEALVGDLDAARLDAVVRSHPVRVQHRTGQLWVLNTAGLWEAGAFRTDARCIERDEEGRPTGRIWRGDDWLRRAAPMPAPDLRAVAAELAATGVTGVTDATPYACEDDYEAIVAAVTGGDLRQRVYAMGLDPPGASPIRTGPLKLVLDEPRLPGLNEAVARIALARRRDRAVAVHALTRTELVFAIAALRVAGTRPGDRIEHAAVVPPQMFAKLRALGLTVVVQPHHLRERGDLQLRFVDRRDLSDLHRLGSLAACGIPLAAGSDAPFGSSDPWVAIAAAVERRTARGAELGPGERLTPLEALKLYLGDPLRPGMPRQIRVGTRDTVLLHGPLREVLAEPRADWVARTFIDGKSIYVDG